MSTLGGDPCSSSHWAGVPTKSPFLSRDTISTTGTGGNIPVRSSLRRLPAISPLSVISRNSAFKLMRSAPLMLKARAISRLPAFAPAGQRKSRICCFEGSLPTVLFLDEPVRFATRDLSTFEVTRLSREDQHTISWTGSALTSFLILAVVLALLVAVLALLAAGLADFFARFLATFFAPALPLLAASSSTASFSVVSARDRVR